MSICITTGFKNIGRGNWNAFTRGRNVYLDSFRKLVRECPYPLFAYLEQSEREELDISSPNLTVFPMEGCDILAYSHMEKDWEVLNSPEYKILMNRCNHKEEHPERSQKGYNMVTSSKSNLVLHTKKLCPGYDFYAWQDFGRANVKGGIPKLFDLTKLAKNKIVIKGMTHDPTKGPKIDPVGFARLGGAAYVCSAQIIVPASMVETFDHLMRAQIDFNHSIGLTDDDQSILAVVASNYPNLFDWVQSKGDWFGLYDRLCER